MDKRPGSTPTPAGMGSQSLQRSPGDHSVDLSADLDSAEDAEHAEHAERLEADRRLRDALAAANFTGPAYAAFEKEYVAFGLEQMTALLRSGYIFARCREIDLYLPTRRIPARDRKELALETVERAVPWFKARGLEQGGWQPELGASLKTYFTRALLYQFANVWRKYLKTAEEYRLRAAQESALLVSLEALPYDIGSPGPDPADIFMQREDIRHALASIEARTQEARKRTQAVLYFTENGYSQAEIAEILGTTRGAVEGLLRRHRERIAARAAEEKRIAEEARIAASAAEEGSQ
jgi:DNA-directed RNA polymerase specialized sigma24 family protein